MQTEGKVHWGIWHASAGITAGYGPGGSGGGGAGKGADVRRRLVTGDGG